MAYCPKCAAKIEEGTRYCPNCGSPVSAIPVVSYEYQNEPTNGYAIAGFVLSFFIPILGIVFSAIGMGRASQLNGKGKGLAIAGLIISIVSMIIGFLTLFFY